MQHATVAEEPATGDPAKGTPAAASGNAFVINLMSSTTPVALVRPDHAGLKRFTFFVSRRREDGRERFRLHMGYFDSQQEGEQLLDIVRAIYPGAWVGLAPGRRRSAGASPASAAAPEAAAAPAVAAVPPAAALTLVPDAGRALPADVTERTTSAAAVPAQRGDDAQDAARSMSSVRETIAALTDGSGAAGRQRGAARPTGARARVARSELPIGPIPELQAAVIPTVRPPEPSQLTDTATLRLLETGRATPEAGAAAAAVPPTVIQRLPDTVVQRVALTAAEPAVQASDSAGVPTEKTWYAVQLLWSVQPIDLTQIPQLAIFSAYTLYGAEGNREGRRWYGLRLGFFTDAVSAKQVAHYVRADFATVSVVPVTDREREQARKAATRAGDAVEDAGGATAVKRATEGAASRAAGSTPAHPAKTPGPTRAGARRVSASSGAVQPAQAAEFKFIDDGPPSSAASAAAHGSAAARSGTVRATRAAPGKRAKVRPPGQIQGRASAKPKTLEETLEILGANTLQVENDSAPSINDSGVRHVRVEITKGKPSKLSRLIERLSERRG